MSPQSIEALLGQTYADFELVISDNASTDETGDICRRYEKEDSRVRYFRQPKNIGLAPNHNYVVEQSRGELFKWSANDDLYARDLVKRCVAALDEYPDVVLAHSWTAKIDDTRKGDGRLRIPDGLHRLRQHLNVSAVFCSIAAATMITGSCGSRCSAARR